MIKYAIVSMGLLSILGVSACGSDSSSSSITSTLTPASVAPTPTVNTTVRVSVIKGKNYLVSSSGMTLYVFSQDAPDSGKSACVADCAVRWPALILTGAGTAPTVTSGLKGTLGIITRDNGAKQVTWNGLPLYIFSGDTKPGDTNGNYPGWSPMIVEVSNVAPTSGPSVSPFPSSVPLAPPYGY